MKTPEAHDDLIAPPVADGTQSLHPGPLSNSVDTKRFALFTAGLVILFILPLYRLARFALDNELFSYVALVPFISAYLWWTNRDKSRPDISKDFRVAAIPAFFGIALGIAALAATRLGWKISEADYLSMSILSFVSFFIAGCFAFLGTARVSTFAFPLGFLIFMAPFPDFVRHGIETFLQHASAEAAYAMLKIAGMPVYREGLVFKLPGFAMHVAPECSGIRSSLILFITSLIASNIFLKGTASRLILIASVVILGILRNGFRIFLLGELCVHVDPDIINSALHHRGGPIFFALSLVPLFFLLFYLRKRELRKSQAHVTSQG